MGDPALDDGEGLPEVVSPYFDAPGWYWRMAVWLGGWRGEVQWWVALALLGFVAGLVVGFLAGAAL